MAQPGRKHFEVTEFDDYRSLVRAWLEAKPRGRSMRSLAKRLGTSHAFVSMVLSGQRHLALDDVKAWTTAMGLSVEEGLWLDALVRKEHGPTREARREAAWEIVTRRVLARERPELVPLFASVTGQVLAELARVGLVEPEDTASLAARFRPPLSGDQLAGAVAAARGASLVGPGAATATRVAGRPLAAAVSDFHRETLENAARALQEDPPSQRHFASLVVALPSSALPEVEVRLRDALLRAIGPWQDGAAADRVFQISVQVVARTEVLGAAP